MNWGMAAPSPTLPRGTRIKVGTVGTLERILFGPAHVTDGSENLVGALRQSMAALGARTIREMQRVEMVYAPSIADRGQVLAAEPLTGRGGPVPSVLRAGRPDRRRRVRRLGHGSDWTFGPTIAPQASPSAAAPPAATATPSGSPSPRPPRRPPRDRPRRPRRNRRPAPRRGGSSVRGPVRARPSSASRWPCRRMISRRPRARPGTSRSASTGRPRRARAPTSRSTGGPGGRRHGRRPQLR